MENRKVEFSHDELLQQNKALSEELSQCQKDKDFVWNLWKNLQVEKPDITSVISAVIEREQQKSDAKDLKVLNILQQKDEQIKILQEIGAESQAHLKEANERLSELLVEQGNWEEQITVLKRENDRLNDQLDEHKEKLVEHEEQLRVFELKSKEKLNTIQGTNEALQEECDELQRTISSFKRVEKKKSEEMGNLANDLQEKEWQLLGLNKKLLEEKKKFDDLSEKEEELETNFEELKSELKKKISELDELQEDLEVRDEQLRKNAITIGDQNENIQQQQDDINCLRKELEEQKRLSRHVHEQIDLIKNLEHLQDETQTVLTKQQETYQKEVTSYQTTIAELTKKTSRLKSTCDKLTSENKKIRETLLNEKAEMMAKDTRIRNLKSSLDETYRALDIKSGNCSRCAQLEEELSQYQRNNEELLQNYTKKCHELSSVVVSNNELEIGESMNLSVGLSEVDERNHYCSKLKVQHNMIEELQKLTHCMEKELNTTRQAHKQRLTRYKMLQENYTLVLQQLATYEEEEGSREKMEKPIPRASQKSLRHEGSSSVWNELEYYRREYGKLDKERPKLEEELDELKIERFNEKTTIQKLKTQVSNLQQSLDGKEEEITSLRQQIMTSRSSFDKQLEDLLEKLTARDDAFNSMERHYLQTIAQRDQKHQEKNRVSTTEFQVLQHKLEQTELEAERNREKVIKDKIDASTQTSLEESYNSKQLLEKMNEIIDAVQGDRLTVSLLESKNMTSHHNITTQTTPPKVSFTRIEKSIQTDETTSDGSFVEDRKNSEKLSKRKQKLGSETQRLLTLKSELHHENRSLKKRVTTLENQVTQLRESKNSAHKEITILTEENNRIKSELVNSLQKLQVTREILKDRSSELERCSEEMQNIATQQQNEKQSSIDTGVELKTLRGRMKEMAVEHSKVNVQMTSIEHENKLLMQKLKQSQDRVIKLEKGLSQKKTYIEELKEKYNEMKNKVDEDTDSKEALTKKVKAFSERENKNKTFIDQLKSKVDILSRDKMLLSEHLHNVRIELENKSKLLEDSQRLCRNAESAITEMEKTAYQQLKNQQDGFSGKHNAIRTRYDKAVSKLNEMKLAITNFTESLLTQIHENRSNLVKKRKETSDIKHVTDLEEKAKSLACSLLDMTASDFEEFMNEEDSNEASISDNDVRSKLESILKKEENFGKVLTWFLMDLVNYNHQLFKDVNS